MNIEKVIKLSEMIISATKGIDEITRNNYDFKKLNLKLTALTNIGEVNTYNLSREEVENYFGENEGKTDLCDAWNFYEQNRHGIDSAFDADPERVTEIISNADIEIKKALQKINVISDAVKKVDGEKERTFLLLNSLYGRLYVFSEIFKEYLKGDDPRFAQIEGFFIDSNKARTFLKSIEINPEKDKVLGTYYQRGLIKNRKFSELLRACKEFGLIENPEAIRQRIKRTKY